MSTAHEPTLTLALTAEERVRSRYRYRLSGEITDGSIRCDTNLSLTRPRSKQTRDLYLEMPRGTVLHDGDCLSGAEHDQVLKIVAKPEPVITVRALEGGQLSLLKAAYHLGNRHVALEIGVDYLRLAPDSVLESMLHQLGVAVTQETVPFQPEVGAYGHHH